MPEDFKPHENYYLISTHQQFLLEQTIKPIADSRRICQELRAELQSGQVKPARAIMHPQKLPVLRKGAS